MKEIGHTIYSGFCGLICEVGTICCGVRKKGKGEEGREALVLVLDMFNT
jgi:hypothetical protein